MVNACRYLALSRTKSISQQQALKYTSLRRNNMELLHTVQGKHAGAAVSLKQNMFRTRFIGW